MFSWCEEETGCWGKNSMRSDSNKLVEVESGFQVPAGNKWLMETASSTSGCWGHLRLASSFKHHTIQSSQTHTCEKTHLQHQQKHVFIHDLTSDRCSSVLVFLLKPKPESSLLTFSGDASSIFNSWIHRRLSGVPPPPTSSPRPLGKMEESVR